MNKTILTIFIGICLVLPAQAQLTWNIIARTPQGILVDTFLVVSIQVHEQNEAGSILLSKTDTIAVDGFGRGSVSLGNIDEFENIINTHWENAWVTIQLVSNNLFLLSQKINAVPYALKAKKTHAHLSQNKDTLYFNEQVIVFPNGQNLNPTISGCTDPSACNFNSLANIENNSCLYAGSTCDDNNPATTNDIINEGCGCMGLQSSGTGNYLIPGLDYCANEYISVEGCGGQTQLNYQGFTYDLVELAGQCWFADNLRANNLNDGTPIPTVANDFSWFTSKTATKCYVVNSTENFNNLGYLYGKYAVNSQKVCPTGWHVPTECDWDYLEYYFGLPLTLMDVNYGNVYRVSAQSLAQQMKNNSWNNVVPELLNKSQFNVYKSRGYRVHNGIFIDQNQSGTDEGYLFASFHNLTKKSNQIIIRSLEEFNDGYSSYSIGKWRGNNNYGYNSGAFIRCVKNGTNYPVVQLQGCTNPASCNYSPYNQVDDGSCITIGTPCNDEVTTVETINDQINNYCACWGTLPGGAYYSPESTLLANKNQHYYLTVNINGKRWMADNLRTTYFENGDEIPGIENVYNPSVMGEGQYLYPFDVITDSRNICPTGWHVANESDWNNLIGFLSTNHYPNALNSPQSWTAASKMLINYNNISSSYTNSAGLCVLPEVAHWWSVNPNDSTNGYTRSVDTNSSPPLVYRNSSSTSDKHFVRCVQD